MSTVDFITTLFYEVDEQMRAILAWMRQP